MALITSGFLCESGPLLPAPRGGQRAGDRRAGDWARCSTGWLHCSSSAFNSIMLTHPAHHQMSALYRSMPEVFFSGALTEQQTDDMYRSGLGITNCTLSGRWLCVGSPSSGTAPFTHVPFGFPHGLLQVRVAVRAAIMDCPDGSDCLDCPDCLDGR